MRWFLLLSMLTVIAGCEGEAIRVEHKHEVEHRIKFDQPARQKPR